VLELLSDQAFRATQEHCDKEVYAVFGAQVGLCSRPRLVQDDEVQDVLPPYRAQCDVVFLVISYALC
jgi:hypothetical protein